MSPTEKRAVIEHLHTEIAAIKEQKPLLVDDLANALRTVMVESGICNWDSAGRPWLQKARKALFDYELESQT